MANGSRKVGRLAAAAALAAMLAAPVAAPSGAQETGDPLAGTIHAGSCDAPDAQALAPAVDVRLRSEIPDAIDVAVGSGETGQEIDALVATPHVVLVTLGGDLGNILACGDLGGSVEGNDLAVGLRERNHSDVTGIAWLRRSGEGSRLTVFAGAGLTQSQFAAPEDGATGTADGEKAPHPTLRVNFNNVVEIPWPVASGPAAPVHAFGGLTGGKIDNVTAYDASSFQVATGAAVPAGEQAFVGLSEMNGSGWSGVFWTQEEGSSTMVKAFLAKGLAQPAEMDQPLFDPVAPADPADAPAANDPAAVEPPTFDPPAEEAPAAAVQEAPAVEPAAQDGASHESARFGYSVAWGPEWQLEGPVYEDAVGEMLSITNGTSVVKFEALLTDKTPTDLLDTLYEKYGRSPNLQSIGPMLDADGQPLAGGTADDLFETWMLTFPDREVVIRARVIQLVPGESLLASTQFVFADSYDAEVPGLDGLYAGLTLP